MRPDAPQHHAPDKPAPIPRHEAIPRILQWGQGQLPGDDA
jgi:hypothetical protein